MLKLRRLCGGGGPVSDCFFCNFASLPCSWRVVSFQMHCLVMISSEFDLWVCAVSDQKCSSIGIWLILLVQSEMQIMRNIFYAGTNHFCPANLYPLVRFWITAVIIIIIFCFKQNGGNILLYYAIVCNESDTRGRKFLNTKQPARTILSFPRVLVRTRQLPTRLLRYDCSAAGTKESLCEYVVSSKFIAV